MPFRKISVKMKLFLYVDFISANSSPHQNVTFESLVCHSKSSASLLLLPLIQGESKSICFSVSASPYPK